MKKPLPAPETKPTEPPPISDPAEEVIQALLAVADDVARLLAEAKLQAKSEITRALHAELLRSIDRMVVSRFRWLIALMLLGMVALMLIAAVGGYWLHAASPAVTCAGQNGGVVCWYWMTPGERKL